jgi:uncharacterized protein (TIGR00661 family)
MKVLYAIQCTGNGHLTRSLAIINELNKYVETDILVSGNYRPDAFPIDPKYVRDGLTYYTGKSGSFNFLKTFSKNSIRKFVSDTKKFPAYKYDLIISDFEPISLHSARINGVPSVTICNQAALLGPNDFKPFRPYWFSELVTKYFCKADKKYPLFYENYSDEENFLVIRNEVQQLKPTDGEHFLVYLPFYSNQKIAQYFNQFDNVKWHIFSPETAVPYHQGNCKFIPTSQEEFLNSLASCKGVLSSSSFGLTSEALYLKKKLMVMPMKSQFEQQCNANFLESKGIPVINSLSYPFISDVMRWVNCTEYPEIALEDQTNKLVRKVLVDFVKDMYTIPMNADVDPNNYLEGLEDLSVA